MLELVQANICLTLFLIHNYFKYVTRYSASIFMIYKPHACHTIANKTFQSSSMACFSHSFLMLNPLFNLCRYQTEKTLSLSLHTYTHTHTHNIYIYIYIHTHTHTQSPLVNMATQETSVVAWQLG